MSTKKKVKANTKTKVKTKTKGELRDRVAELEAQLLEKNDNSSVSTPRKREFDLRADDFVGVVSLCNHTLSLSTGGSGKGRIYTFTKFGEKKPIIYSDVMSIIEYHMNFIESGLFYIEDEDVVNRHGLQEIYSKILNKENIEEIVSCGELSIGLYELANDGQRKIIDRILISKLVDGENIDLNIVSSISRISGKDLVELAEEVKLNMGK